jgi:hypothetical protein
VKTKPIIEGIYLYNGEISSIFEILTVAMTKKETTNTFKAKTAIIIFSPQLL